VQAIKAAKFEDRYDARGVMKEELWLRHERPNRLTPLFKAFDLPQQTDYSRFQRGYSFQNIHPSARAPPSFCRAAPSTRLLDSHFQSIGRTHSVVEWLICQSDHDALGFTKQ
jgi:hypothetical protein